MDFKCSLDNSLDLPAAGSSQGWIGFGTGACCTQQWLKKCPASCDNKLARCILHSPTSLHFAVPKYVKAAGKCLFENTVQNEPLWPYLPSNLPPWRTQFCASPHNLVYAFTTVGITPTFDYLETASFFEPWRGCSNCDTCWLINKTPSLALSNCWTSLKKSNITSNFGIHSCVHIILFFAGFSPGELAPSPSAEIYLQPAGIQPVHCCKMSCPTLFGP